MDLIHYLVFIPNEVLFIVHHIATLFVLITCRYLVNHGAFPMLVLLILAEITSACQNVWTIAGFRRSDVPAAAKLYESLSPFFYVLYSIARGILAPMFVYKLVVFYLSGGGDGVIPMWAWVSWIIVISSGILVSLVWILNLWIALFRERSKQKLV
ncbi:hypothetical protein Nepgr_003359 [Nepenthes gracilis]|uniref:TLC domain-containing protein n=1 Tax=Nepenthes gracilis TaxID=150966 RepID=A0AAD3RZC7_NEPGR|nr:hypothetical protein Nepgr_003359 [Nepenthes gracilis]